MTKRAKRDRTEITAAEIIKAFHLPHDARLALHPSGDRGPVLPIDKITIVTAQATVSPQVVSDPTFIPG